MSNILSICLFLAMSLFPLCKGQPTISCQHNSDLKPSSDSWRCDKTWQKESAILEARMKRMEQDAMRRDAESVALKARISTLERAGRLPVVYFRAYLSQDTTFHNNEKIRLTPTASSSDNSYNPRSGVYTCPRSGLYIFSMGIMKESQPEKEVSLYCDSDVVLQIMNSGGETRKSHGGSVAVLCNRGQAVHMEPNAWNSASITLRSSHHTYLTGALVYTV